MHKRSVFHLRHMLCLLGWVGLSACQPPPESSPLPAPVPAMVVQDGDKTVDTPNTVLNRYAVLAQNATVGATRLEVDAVNLQALQPLQPGDLLLVVQMQGALVANTPASATHGAVTNLNSAGLFDWVRVAAVQASQGWIELDTTRSQLRHAYEASGHVQVIRVPQYRTLNILAGAGVTAPAWDGKIGGVVAVQAEHVLLNGTIDVSGLGFRGGALDAVSNPADMALGYASSSITNGADGAEKGEGVAGSTVEYNALGGAVGRGAMANGGGGGNAYKAGGGGGANAFAGMTPWNGQGVRDTTVTGGAVAWPLECMGMCALSSGGGRGGYTNANPNPMTMPQPTPLSQGPGHLNWAGNLRRERGGLGGRPLSGIDPEQRVFFGGGGGAGDRDGAVAMQSTGRGGAGGGLVYVIAKQLEGMGTIHADGAAGESTAATDANQGAGGGGGGGSVVLRAKQWQGIQVFAQGGQGGTHSGASVEADGPGGGGGGGFIATAGGAPFAKSVTGGKAGTSASAAITAFPANGASHGADGLAPTVSLLSADLAVTVEANVANLPIPTNSFVYTIRVVNRGLDFVDNADLKGVLPSNYPGVTWQCQNPESPWTQCDTPQGTGALHSLVSLAPGTHLTFAVTVPIPSYVTQESVSYQATVAVPPGYTDPTPANNQQLLTLEPAADVQLGLLPQFAYLQNAQPLAYDIPINNLGPYCAYNVQVVVDLSAGWTFPQLGGNGWTCVTNSSTQATCTLPELVAGASSRVRMGLSSAAPPAFLHVHGQVTSTTLDPNLTNNHADDEWSLDRLPTTVAGGSLQCHAGAGGNPWIAWFPTGLVVGGWLLLRRWRGRYQAWALRSRAAGAAVVALVCVSLSTQAVHADGFQVNRFEPTTVGESSLGVDHPWYTQKFSIAAGLMFNYAYHPLVFGGVAPDGSFLKTHTVLDHQLLGHVNLAASWLNRVTVTASLPITLLERGGSFAGLAPVDKVVAGDPRFGVNVRLWGDAYNDPFSIHLLANLWVPTQAAAAQVGDSNVRFLPRLVLGGLAKRVLWSFSTGVSYRPDSTLGVGLPPYNSIGPQLHLGAALAYADKARGFSVGPEVLFDSVITQGAAFQKASSHLELLLGAHYQVHNHIQLSAGGGMGLLENAGTPDARVLFSIAYTPPRKAKAPAPVPTVKVCAPEEELDLDHDGVKDPVDQCIDVPKGDHPDGSRPGCPDKDTDGDGVYDYKDQCPDKSMGDHPDLTSSERWGCPLPDRDGDGVLDGKDQCPDTPEGSRPNPKKPGCPRLLEDDDCAKNVQMQDQKLLLSEQIRFETNKAVINPVSYPILQKAATYLHDHPEIALMAIDGHTDISASDEYNRLLSIARANSVRAWLIKNGRIAEGRLLARGFGRDRPIADNKIAGGRAVNRRVEFTVLQGGATPGPTH